jgi:hypothetical protein
METFLAQHLGLTLTTLGEVMVGYTVIRVHYRFWKEHKVDERVFLAMWREQQAATIGIILIIAGYLVQVLK